MCGKAQRVARPGANTRAKLRGYWTNVHQIFIRRTGVIGGVNACIHVAILARLMSQYCYASCRLSSATLTAGVPAAGRVGGRPPPGRTRGRPTLHGGPVRLRPVRATPCYLISIPYLTLLLEKDAVKTLRHHSRTVLLFHPILSTTIDHRTIECLRYRHNLSSRWKLTHARALD